MAKAKWPAIWAMTDERMGDALWPALDRLPDGSGVVFRHHRSADRDELAARVAELARRRGLALAVSRDISLARRLGAALVHNPAECVADLAFSLSVHSIEEAKEANRRGAALAFVSPVYPTRSHPGARTLSRDDALSIVAALDCPAIALGGVDAHAFEALKALGFSGWAGIDAWIRT